MGHGAGVRDEMRRVQGGGGGEEDEIEGEGSKMPKPALKKCSQVTKKRQDSIQQHCACVNQPKNVIHSK